LIFGKGQILGADHQRYQKISKDCGDRGNQKKENHRHAVHGEELVVSFGGDQITGGREEVDADQGGENAADEEENGDRAEIQEGDALVVGGEQPRFEAVRGVQVVLVRHGLRGHWCWRLAHDLFLPAAGSGCDCNDLM